MAPLWLKHVAHQAVPPSLVFGITHVETPQGGNDTGVCKHCTQETPDQHEHTCVETQQEQEDGILCVGNTAISRGIDIHYARVDEENHGQDEHYEKIAEDLVAG